MIATISAIHSLSPRVKAFDLQMPESVRFLSGQFVILKVEIDGQWVERSYSIANAVQGDTMQITLCVALNLEGKLTPWLFGASVGQSLEVSIPQGGFVLRDDSKVSPTLFVCTGTGIAPFRSMIQERLSQPDSSPVCLVMGNRFSEDMLYHQEWLSLQQAESRFRYVSTLSRAESEIDSVRKGYVHDHYLKFVSAHPDVHVYVCGWELMCREARQRLKDLGLTRRQYFFEQYDG